VEHTPDTPTRPQGFQPGQVANPSGLRVIKGEHDLACQLATEFTNVALTAIDWVLLHQAARLLIRASRCGDPDVVVRLNGEGRRTLEGLRRRYGKHIAAAAQAGPTLYDHLDQIVAEEKAQQKAAERMAEGAQASDADGAEP
jgi:hypothetical protein